jgi:hypothetical protein
MQILAVDGVPLFRNDDFFNNRKTRTYEISFIKQYSHGTLFRTERHHSLRGALLEAHTTLDRMGLKPPSEENHAN